METFLIINVDLYNIADTTKWKVEATSRDEALKKVADETDGEELYDWFKDNLNKVDSKFACYQGEESSWLVYTL